MAWPLASRPLIVTVASDEVERLVSKNGLLFHELISAFSHCQLKSSFRSINHNYTLDRLRVKFVRASEVRPRPMPKVTATTATIPSRTPFTTEAAAAVAAAATTTTTTSSSTSASIP